MPPEEDSKYDVRAQRHVLSGKAEHTENRRLRGDVIALCNFLSRGNREGLADPFPLITSGASSYNPVSTWL